MVKSMYKYSKYFMKYCRILGVSRFSTLKYLRLGLINDNSNYPFISNKLNRYIINSIYRTKDGAELSEINCKIHSANYYALVKIDKFIDKHLNTDLSVETKLNINSFVYKCHLGS